MQRENWQLRQHLMDLRRTARQAGVNLTADQMLLTFPEVEALLDANGTSTSSSAGMYFMCVHVNGAPPNALCCGLPLSLFVSLIWSLPQAGGIRPRDCASGQSAHHWVPASDVWASQLHLSSTPAFSLIVPGVLCLVWRLQVSPHTEPCS